MKKQLGPKTFLFPVPAALVTSHYRGIDNVLAIGWISMASQIPPQLLIEVNPARLSFNMIRESGEFCVNIPPASLYAKVDYCGVMSGRDVDKFKETGLTKAPGAKVRAPLIKECPYNIECVLRHELDIAASHKVMVGEIVEVHADEDKISVDGDKLAPDIGKMDPLAYCSGVREYWSLGKKVGDAYSAWKKGSC